MDNNQISSAVVPASNRWQRKPNPPRRILVVDDEPLIRLLYIRVLVEAGNNTESAQGGAVAWDEVQVTDYDLLITDNQMPNVSGVDLLKKIYVTRIPLPVIMATGTFPEEEFTRAP